MTRTALLAITLSAILFSMTITIPAFADSVTGDIFYTRFGGTPNVKEVSVNYDGVSTFTLGTPIAIGTTPGADGIAGNPQNSDLLFVGGKGFDISPINSCTNHFSL